MAMSASPGEDLAGDREALRGDGGELHRQGARIIDGSWQPPAQRLCRAWRLRPRRCARLRGLFDTARRTRPRSACFRTSPPSACPRSSSSLASSPGHHGEIDVELLGGVDVAAIRRVFCHIEKLDALDLQFVGEHEGERDRST